MKIVAVQKRRNTPQVSLTFKKATSEGVKDFMEIPEGMELTRVLNLCIKDYNRDIKWLEGTPNKKGTYVVETVDEYFNIVNLSEDDSVPDFAHGEPKEVKRFLKIHMGQ